VPPRAVVIHEPAEWLATKPAAGAPAGGNTGVSLFHESPTGEPPSNQSNFHYPETGLPDVVPALLAAPKRLPSAPHQRPVESVAYPDATPATIASFDETVRPPSPVGLPTSAELAPPPPTRTHRIVDGDSLPKLATRYLRDAARSAEIFDLNRELLHSPDLLPIGAELKLPDR
jgi:nucleoid-associated protein YgaU